MKVVMGGTFDPVHHGHLRMALEVREALKAEVVDLLPCYQPVHRATPGTPLQHRLAMLERVVEQDPALRIDTSEICREGPSYMVDTLRSLRLGLGETPLVLVMGMDAFAHFDSWHQWQAIPELAHLLIVHRPPGALPANGAVFSLLKERQVSEVGSLAEGPGGRICMLPTTSLEISSTDIRARIGAGQSARYLLPETVWAYIQEQGLYC